jgi:hypothetical protein
MQRFDSEAATLPVLWSGQSDGWGLNPTPHPGFRVAESSEPARAATFESDVWVPFAQAAATLAVVVVVAVALGVVWPGPLVAGCVVGGVVWFATLADGRQLLRRTRRILGAAESSAPAAPSVVRHEYLVKEDQGDGRAHEQLVDLPCDPQQLRTFAAGILGGRGTAVSAWTGKGQPFSRAQYDQLVGELITRGFARRASKSPTSTWELTGKGRAWFRGLAAGGYARVCACVRRGS